jgi:hypothetical protein
MIDLTTGFLYFAFPVAVAGLGYLAMRSNESSVQRLKAQLAAKEKAQWAAEGMSSTPPAGAAPDEADYFIIDMNNESLEVRHAEVAGRDLLRRPRRVLIVDP